MVNVTNCQKLLAALRKERVDGVKIIFNMAHWVSQAMPLKVKEPTDPICGTAACLGGTATMVMLYEQAPQYGAAWLVDHGRDYSYVQVARWLGLDVDKDEELHLFNMSRSKYRFADATLEAGIRVVELLIETGEVDWDRAIDETGGPAPKKRPPAKRRHPT